MFTVYESGLVKVSLNEQGPHVAIIYVFITTSIQVFSLEFPPNTMTARTLHDREKVLVEVLDAGL